MNQQMPSNPEPLPSPNPTRWLYVSMVVLALIIIGLSVWLIKTKQELKVLQEEKEMQRVELQTELDSLLAEHDAIKRSYGQLSDSLSVKDSVIQARASEIKQLLNYKWEYFQVKKKLERLQLISQGYVRQMDSLYTVNKQLTEENIRIKEEYQIEQRKIRQLEQDKTELNTIISEASNYSVYNLKAEGIRVRGDKESTTDKIRKLDRIKICFFMPENSLIEPGAKTIYVRIARPEDKEILVTGRGNDFSFNFQGEQLQYSIKEDIIYENNSQEICMYWSKRKTFEMQEGLYHIDLFEGDQEIGHTTLTLRK